jgi:hypothetical protein
MEKRIETAAMKGRAILHLNNLPNGMVLQSEALCQASTDGEFHFRTLGLHAEAKCECRAMTAMVNGNNVSVASDLVERTVAIRLNAKTPYPGERQFRFDPLALVRARRGEYLSMVFTVVRWGLQNIRQTPKGVVSIAGFEGWSKFVQWPLVELGCVDPLANRQDLRDADTSREEFEILVRVLELVIKNALSKKFTVSQLDEKADYFPELENLMTYFGKRDTTRFGRMLAKHVDRVSEKGWVLVKRGKLDGYQQYELVVGK